MTTRRWMILLVLIGLFGILIGALSIIEQQTLDELRWGRSGRQNILPDGTSTVGK